MESNQIYRLLYRKGNYKSNEKTTHRMGENIYNWWNQQDLLSKICKQLKKKKKNPEKRQKI